MKRTGLTRSSSLPPGSGPSRRIPLRAVSAKKAATRQLPKTTPSPPRPPGEFTPAVKLLVRKRAGQGDEFEALAECCGKWLGRDVGEYQHRAARGAGGCRDAVINGPANCLLMCPECHREAERRSRDLGMNAAGFWIEHGTTPGYDPRNVAIMLHGEGSGMTVYLAADGLGLDGTGYLTERPQEVAA